MLFDCLVQPYLVWLESVCSGGSSSQNIKYKNIVMMENTWWLRHTVSSKKALKEKVDKYCKLYAQELYYYQYDDKLIKHLRVDSTENHQMKKICQKVKLDVSDI